MTPDAVRDALHALELRMVKEISHVSSKLDSALAVRIIVEDHEIRIRELAAQAAAQAAQRGRIAWSDVGKVVIVIASIAGAVGAVVSAVR